VFFVNNLEPDEFGIIMCLMLQNKPNVTVTPIAAQNTREHPNRVKEFVEIGMEAHILPNSD